MENNISILGNSLALKVELFRRGMFDFITVVDCKKHEKQEEALNVLADDSHVEFLYGGAAGGAKTWTGCAWISFSCLAYEGTKWFIGREELKRLRDTTLITFYKVCKRYGITPGIHFKYNGQDHYIEFFNGSRIDLLDLRHLPSDIMYERYGSSEYTGGWIEEAGEVDFGAYDTLKTRIGRHLNDKFGLLRKLFITCNPKKNWLYEIFYKPSLSESLPDHMYYLSCLVQENPFIEKGYIDALNSTSDKSKKERLLNGNWEYALSEYSVFEYETCTLEEYKELAVYENAGIDFGDVTDKNALVGVKYVSSENKLYLHEYLYKTKMSDFDLYEKVKDLKFYMFIYEWATGGHTRILNMKKMGFGKGINYEILDKVKKPPVADSVMNLQSMKLVVVETDENLRSELDDYKIDEETGEYIGEDHLIDATRYIHHMMILRRIIKNPYRNLVA